MKELVVDVLIKNGGIQNMKLIHPAMTFTFSSTFIQPTVITCMGWLIPCSTAYAQSS